MDAERLGRRVIAATNIVPHRAVRATQDGRERVGCRVPPLALAHGNTDCPLCVLVVSKRFAGRGQKQVKWWHRLTFATLTMLG
jgi:hypothetical protein